jgi:L-threonylcarbamoyladenylate synthase
VLTPADAAALGACVAAGGVAVFPADTVYGLACDPESESAVRRLYELKGRPAQQPAAVMFFSLPRLLEALPELGPNTRTLLERLLPGAFTVLVDNPRGRFPLAGAAPGAPLLGLRVPAATGLEAVRVPVLQSSANLSGGADARTVGDVPDAIRDGADLVLDAGELPGVASTIVDLSRYERHGEWEIRREGAVRAARVAELIAAARS